jgi:hypothetical protein
MNTKEDYKPLLERVFGDDIDIVRARIENRQERAIDKVLSDAGIDSDALVERALKQIELPERSGDLEAPAPLRVYDLTDEEFEQLDEEEIDFYLESHGVEVLAMLERVESSVRAPVSDLEHEPTIDQLDLVGVAAAKISPDDITPVAQVKTFRPFRPAMAAGMAGLVLVAGISYFMANNRVFDSFGEPSEVAATSSLIADDSGLERDAPLVVAMNDPNRSEVANAMTAASVEIEAASSSLELKLASNAVERATAETAEVELLALLAAENTKQANTQAFSSGNSNATLVAAALSVTDEVSVLDVSTNKREFTFERGDTLSHGMMEQGVPLDFQSRLARNLQVVFRPGDKAVFYFLDDEFERLELILDQGKMITINRNLNMETQEVGKPTILLVSGRIKGSLNASFVEALDANAAWRIEQVLKRENVPFTTLPKGTTFEVEIEQMVIVGSDVVRYGTVKYVHINTGTRQYTVGSKAAQAYLTPFSAEFTFS